MNNLDLIKSMDSDLTSIFYCNTFDCKMCPVIKCRELHPKRRNIKYMREWLQQESDG